MRPSTRSLIAIGSIVVLLALLVTDRILPVADTRAFEIRSWLAARALGVTAYLLLALQVGMGVVLSHPENRARWRVTKVLFPWHELLTVFTGAFLALHVVLLATDRFAQVGWLGALVPGLSDYRSPAIALGTVAAYAFLVTAITARWTRLLPAGWWLRIHRVAAAGFLLAWAHAILAGTDSNALTVLYIATGVPVLAAIAHRWWTVRVAPGRRDPIPTRARPARSGDAAVAMPGDRP
jgi:hypothetical protein